MAEYVTANQIEITATITPAIDQWMQQHMPKNAGGQIDRVARRFALAAIAGEMATDAGLTGWSKGEASQGAATCFNAWLESFGGIGDCEETRHP
jgi:putative DNA primase/helicase